MEATKCTLSTYSSLLRPQNSSPKKLFIKASNESRRRDYSGRLVDESMIILRVRIREMKMLEANDRVNSSDWMDWEKEYYERYDKDVLEVIGMLQSCLMNVRPSLGIGLMVFVALSVPMASWVVLVKAIEIAKELSFSYGLWF